MQIRCLHLLESLLSNRSFVKAINNWLSKKKAERKVTAWGINGMFGIMKNIIAVEKRSETYEKHAKKSDRYLQGGKLVMLASLMSKAARIYLKIVLLQRAFRINANF